MKKGLPGKGMHDDAFGRQSRPEAKPEKDKWLNTKSNRSIDPSHQQPLATLDFGRFSLACC